MTASTASSLCRITVVSADLRADLAVPMQIPVAELLPVLVRCLGLDAAGEAAVQGGWVLQRASESPLDPSGTLAVGRIRDGDVLHLRTRTTQLPEIAFDDVVEAVGTAVRNRTDRWQDQHTATTCLLFASFALAIGLLCAVCTGPPWRATAIASIATAVALIAVAGALRPLPLLPKGAALVPAWFAVCYAAVGGVASVAGDLSVARFGAPQLLVAAGAALLVATIALLVVAAGTTGFVAVITTALLTAVGAQAADSTSLSVAATAALVAVVALAVSPLLPTLSFRIARLPLPSLADDPVDLRETGSIGSAAVLRRAVLADRYLTGLLGGVTAPIAGAAVLLAAGGINQRTLSLVLAAICLLRARLFTGRGQRSLLLAAGAAALGAAVVVHAVGVDGPARLIGVLATAAVFAAVLLVLALVLPGRRYPPPWSRAADLVETLLVLSVIPLAMAVMGVYGAIRLATG